MEAKLIGFFEAQSAHRPALDENLFESGALDSFGIVEFLGFIQDELGVEIPIDEITEENFSTIQRICELIRNQDH